MHFRFPHSDMKKDLHYMKPCYKSMVDKARKVSFACFLNLMRKLNNSESARKERGQVTIKQIFLKFWPAFKLKFLERLDRPGLVSQIEKSLVCGDPENGFEMYECKKCGARMYVPHTCKSRFCAKCGKKYRDARSVSVCRKLIDVPHRQFVFSVPEELRSCFRKDRSRLDILFRTAEQCFEDLLRTHAPLKYRQEGRRPGLILFLHTYGRDMKWHPHLHILVAERYMRKDGTMARWSYFSFEWLRKAFMYALLKNLKKSMDPEERKSFGKTEKKIRAKFVNGFYVYGPQMKESSIYGMRQLAKYVARYASHPAISESRIDAFDEETGMVTWHYEPHEDDLKEENERKGTQTITEHAFEFIKRLIIHVPDPGFKQIRYYGFYANRCKTDPKEESMCTNGEIGDMLLALRWRYMLLKTYGFDPVMCHCGEQMEYNPLMSYNPGKDDRMWLEHELGFY